MFDLGDTVKLTSRTYDSAGALASASGAIATTVTLPDGTTATPSGSYTSTGVYTATYVTTQAGRHTWRSTFAGTIPDQANTDVFNVWPTTNIGIVGLSETKDHLNIDQTNTSQDEELRRTIDGASAVVEGIVGAVARRSITEVFSGRGGDKAYLSLAPAISVTAVVEGGVTLDPAAYSLHGDRAVLYKVAGFWSRGVNNVSVTYVVGRTIVTGNILDGVKDLIRVNFRPQLGGNRSPFDNVTEQRAEPGQMRLGFYVPNSVMERLNPDAQAPFYL